MSERAGAARSLRWSPSPSVTQRRVHYVPVVSSALLVVAFFKLPLYAAPAWRAIGAALLRPFV